MAPANVGKRLRELREQGPLGYQSRETVARRINVSSKTVERWEQGRLGTLYREPDLLDQLAEAYGVEADDILPTRPRVEMEQPLRELLLDIDRKLDQILERFKHEDEDLGDPPSELLDGD